MTCTPSTPAPARKRRRPNQDLQERLARCEELLKEYATAKARQRACADAEHAGGQRQRRDMDTDGQAGVEDDGGVRFMDSYLLGTVYDELKAMREIVDEEGQRRGHQPRAVVGHGRRTMPT